MTEYGYREQAKHYRDAAWDRGCTCPMMPPHIHLGDCPLYRTIQEWNEFLDQEHEDDAQLP